MAGCGRWIDMQMVTASRKSMELAHCGGLLPGGSHHPIKHAPKLKYDEIMKRAVGKARMRW